MSKVMTLFCWGLMLFLFSNISLASKLTNLQIKENKGVTRLTFQLSESVKPKIFSLSNPERLVIDFPETTLSMNLKKVEHSSSTISSVRAGFPKAKTLRIVLDLKKPTTFKMLAPHPFSIELAASSTKPKPVSSALRKEVELGFKKRPLLIVIDPGHGGKDPGAIGEKGTKEKDIVLTIAKKLADLINQRPNMRAILTREGDYYVTLQDRLLMARKGKADLFIAIHADAHFNSHASGASVYSLSQHGATSIAARWLASRENHSELGGVDLEDLEDQSHSLRSMLIDMAQTQTTKDSLRWGTLMLESLEDVTKLHYSRVERAPFLVLKSPDIPSLLVETGFISNSKEELRLRNKEYQNKIALALFNGIRSYQQSGAPIVGS